MRYHNNEENDNPLDEPILPGNFSYNSRNNNNSNNTGSIERTFNERNANIQAQWRVQQNKSSKKIITKKKDSFKIQGKTIKD